MSFELRLSHKISFGITDSFIFTIGVLYNIGYLLEAVGIQTTGFSLIIFLLFFLTWFYRFSFALPSLEFAALSVSFIVLYYLSFFASDFSSYSVYKIGMFSIKIIPLLMLPLFLKDKFVIFLKGYFISLLLVTILFSYFAISTYQLVHINRRLDIGNIVSIWVARAVLEFLILYALFYFKKSRLFFFAFMITSLFVVYSTGSKGAVLSAAIVFFYYGIKNYSGRNKLLLLIIMSMILVISINLVSRLPDNSYFQQRFLREIPEGSKQVNQSRSVIYSELFEKIPEMNTTLLTGKGVGNYNLFMGHPAGTRTYPHNILLEILIENGIITLTLFILMILLTLKSRSKFTYLVLFFFINANFSGDLILNEKLFLYINFVFIDDYYS
jgi:O-antigen ligase